MLDFNEVFWHADKRGKNAENAKNARKHAENAEKLTENAEKFAKNCGFRNFLRGRSALRTPISKRGLFAHL